MTHISDALRGVIHARCIDESPVELRETAEASRCPPVLVRARGSSWALRLSHGDHLPILAELPQAQSVRKLPDYVVFGQAEDLRGHTGLRVMICELKSSAAGFPSALRQVQMGRFLVEYLVRLAAYQEALPNVPDFWSVGLIVSPKFPPNLSPKGQTRPGKVDPASFYDKLSKMRIFMVAPGGEIRFESFFEAS